MSCVSSGLRGSGGSGSACLEQELSDSPIRDANKSGKALSNCFFMTVFLVVKHVYAKMLSLVSDVLSQIFIICLLLRMY